MCSSKLFSMIDTYHLLIILEGLENLRDPFQYLFLAFCCSIHLHSYFCLIEDKFGSCPVNLTPAIFFIPFPCSYIWIAPLEPCPSLFDYLCYDLLSSLCFTIQGVCN